MVKKLLATPEDIAAALPDGTAPGDVPIWDGDSYLPGAPAGGALPGFSVCVAANAAFTGVAYIDPISFPTVLEDTDGFVTNATDFTVPAGLGGLYELNVNIRVEIGAPAELLIINAFPEVYNDGYALDFLGIEQFPQVPSLVGHRIFSFARRAVLDDGDVLHVGLFCQARDAAGNNEDAAFNALVKYVRYLPDDIYASSFVATRIGDAP